MMIAQMISRETQVPDWRRKVDDPARGPGLARRNGRGLGGGGGRRRHAVSSLNERVVSDVTTSSRAMKTKVTVA